MRSLLTADEAAQLLGMTPGALAVLRHRRKGPAYIKEGRWIRYQTEDIEKWIRSRKILPEVSV